jgi:threonine dehydrogenase-like Zn-dependent dehydrogenase
MRRLMEMIASGRVDLSPLVTHHFALDHIEEAFELFAHQRDGVLKVVLHPAMPKADPMPRLVGISALDDPS